MKDEKRSAENGTDKRPQDRSVSEISRQVAQKQKMRNSPGPSPLRGFGSFGIVGWSIAIPTVAGVFLGIRLDSTSTQDFSWTIALMLGGVALGVLIAWALINEDRD